MSITLNENRGTLIESVIEYADGRYLRIEPLKLGVAVIAFGANGAQQLKSSPSCGEGEILLLDDSGTIVARYAPTHKAIRYENAVLYHTGQVWIGDVHGADPEPVLWVLRESGISLLTEPGGLSFDAESGDERPTILAKFNSDSVALCGGHQCGRCFLAGKEIPSGLMQ